MSLEMMVRLIIPKNGLISGLGRDRNRREWPYFRLMNHCHLRWPLPFKLGKRSQSWEAGHGWLQEWQLLHQQKDMSLEKQSSYHSIQNGVENLSTFQRFMWLVMWTRVGEQYQVRCVLFASRHVWFIPHGDHHLKTEFDPPDFKIGCPKFQRILVFMKKAIALGCTQLSNMQLMSCCLCLNYAVVSSNVFSHYIPSGNLIYV